MRSVMQVRIRNKIQKFSDIHIFLGIACHEKLSRKAIFCWNFYFRFFLYTFCLSFLWEKVAKLWRGEKLIKVSSSVTAIPCPIFVSGDCLTLFRMGGGVERPPTSFSPITSTNVRISPQNFFTFSFNPFDRLV